MQNEQQKWGTLRPLWVIRLVLLGVILSLTASLWTGSGGEVFRSKNNAQDERLFDAASDGDMAGVVRALADGGSPNASCGRGCTALMIAAAGGRVQILDVLLAHGANINATSEAGMTALSAAIARGEAGTVEHLLRCGADPSVHAANTPPAMQLALQYREYKIAELLLAARAGLLKPSERAPAESAPHHAGYPSRI